MLVSLFSRSCQQFDRLIDILGNHVALEAQFSETVLSILTTGFTGDLMLIF